MFNLFSPDQYFSMRACKLVILFAFLCIQKVMIHSAAVPKRSRGAIKTGSIKRFGHEPRMVDGKMQFPDVVDVHIYTEDVINKTLRLKKLPFDASSGLQKLKPGAVYGDVGTIVHVQCDEDTDSRTCHEFALVSDETATVYVKNEGDAIVLPKPTFATETINAEDANLSFGQTGSETSSQATTKRSRRHRRALWDDLAYSRAVKIILFPDKGVMDVFLAMNSNDEALARQDVTTYLSLICNEMSLHYQSLKEYGDLLTVDGATMSMDIVITLVHVEFPPAGENFYFSEDARVGNVVYDTKTEVSTGIYEYSGIFREFRNFIKDSYVAPTPFDHAMVITGYDFKKLTTYLSSSSTTVDLIAIAWNNAVCRQTYITAGLHTGLAEMGGFTARAAAHEIGHQLGMVHDSDTGDTVNCANLKFVMSAPLIYPTEASVDTFHKFSPCSATSLATYTASLSVSEFPDTCLMSADETFWSQFCLGFTSAMTFDTQCRINYGASSGRKTEANETVEANLAAGYVAHCISNDNYSDAPFTCINPSSPDGGYKITVAPPATKCVRPDGAMDPNYACYKGQCLTIEEVCGATPPTTSPETTIRFITTAAPPPPTTTATTTTAAQTTIAPPGTTQSEPVTNTPQPVSCKCSTTSCCRDTRNEDGSCCSGCEVKTKGKPGCQLLPITTTLRPSTTPPSTTRQPPITTEQPPTTTPQPPTTTQQPQTTTQQPQTTTQQPPTTTQQPPTTTQQPQTTTQQPQTTTQQPQTTTQQPQTTTHQPSTTTQQPPTTTQQPQTTTQQPPKTTQQPQTTTQQPSTTTQQPQTTTLQPPTTPVGSCICYSTACCRDTRDTLGGCCSGCEPKTKGKPGCQVMSTTEGPPPATTAAHTTHEPTSQAPSTQAPTTQAPNSSPATSTLQPTSPTGDCSCTTDTCCSDTRNADGTCCTGCQEKTKGKPGCQIEGRKG